MVNWPQPEPAAMPRPGAMPKPSTAPGPALGGYGTTPRPPQAASAAPGPQSAHARFRSKNRPAERFVGEFDTWTGNWTLGHLDGEFDTSTRNLTLGHLDGEFNTWTLGRVI